MRVQPISSMRIVFLSLAGLACLALAPPPSGPPRSLDQIASVEINRDGLSVLAAVVQEQALAPIKHQPIPDVKQDIFGVELGLQGINASAGFGTLTLTPAAGSLAAKTSLTSLNVHAESLTFTTKVFGKKVVTTCSAVDLYLADKRPVEVALQANLGLQGHDLTVTAGHASIVLGYNNARVNGPAHCRPVDVGGLTEAMLQVTLTLLQPFVEDLVNQRIGEALPGLERQLNDTIHRPIAVALPPLPGTQARQLALRPYATGFDLTADGLKILAGGQLAAEPTAYALAQKGRGKAKLTTKIAQVGVHPGLLTTAFQVLYPQGTGVIDVGEDTVPGINNILSIASASAFWPDLLRRQPTQPYVRLQVRLTSAPDLSVAPNGESLQLKLRSVELMFLANLNNVWTDYFVMALDLEGQAVATIDAGQLTVKLASIPALKLDGHWAPGYQPDDPRFEQDVAEAVLTSLLEVVYRRGPLVAAALPQLKAAGKPLGYGAVRMDPPYVGLDVLVQ